jgi:transcriptional regulator with XRE-family HTH domain
MTCPYGTLRRIVACPGERGAIVASAEGPLLHRRRLGDELRRLRGDRTLEEVADATLISTSKLSRLENGQGVPQPRDVRDLVTYYKLEGTAADRIRRWAGAGRSQAWWREYSAALPVTVDVYLDYESGASTIRNWAASIVPPLLQVPAYAAQLYRSIPPVRDEENVRRLVEILGKRQDLLFEQAAAPELIAVLDEAVLHRPLGTAEDHRAQLDHLHAMSRRPNVFLRVVPFAAGGHAGMQGMFTILQYEEDIDRDIAAVESHTGERFFEQHASLREYLRLFDAISRKALDHDDSRGLIAAIRDNPKGPQ